jgi:adenylate cyclase
VIADRLAGLLRPARPEDLPRRVREAIARQQDRSEILIGWVQLAVVGTFAVLYWVAPRPADPDIAFQPVPLVLAAYGAFTLGRLVAAYRMRLPPWFLALSVIADMSLLMTTIWSFHIQYMQPATFYLKAPTLLYVFIFIALRALRFEARYVVLAGVAAAIGWLVLVAYAVAAAGPGALTRDYVRYMTDNALLLGAEFDKVISILMVTAILAVAITIARRLLVDAVARGAEARELARFFDRDVAREITRAETEVAAGEGVLRDAAVLVVDVRGFSTLAAAMPGDELVRLLAEYQARLVPVIRACGGTVDKFLGDGIMATFGAARPSATYAADALRAAGRVLAEADLWATERRAAGKPTLEVGAAVASGRVLFGAVGDGDRLEFTVIGDAVNLACKLEKHNKVERTRALATREAYERALAQGHRADVPAEIREGRAIEGVAGDRDIAIIAG